MSEQPPESLESPEDPQVPEQDADTAREPEWQRRRRLDSIFGDTLPDQTADDRAPGEAGREGKGDRWYRDQVPPHHGV